MKATRRRGILSFFLGLLVGIVLIAGAIVGVGFWAYKGLKVKTIEGWIGTELIKGDDPEAIKDKSIADLITWGSTFFSNSDNLSINKINKTFGDYIPTSFDLGNGATFSLAAIADTPISALGSNINLLLDGVTMGTIKAIITLPDIPILTGDDSLPITKVFDKVSASIGDTASLGSLSADFGLPIPQHPVIDKIKTIPLNQLSTSLNDTLMDMTILEVMGEENCSDRLMNAIKDIKLNALSTTIPTLPISSFMDVGTSGLLFELDKAGATIENLSDKVMLLSLKSVITIDETSPKILQAIQDTTLENLPTAIDSLTIDQILDAPNNGSIIDKLVTMTDSTGNKYKINDIDKAMDALIKDCTVKELASYSGKTLTTLPDPVNGGDLYELTLPAFLDRIEAIIKLL